MDYRDNDDLFITEIRTPSLAGSEDMQSGLGNAYQFLKDLPRVNMDDVPADERECTICQETYGTDGHDTTVVQMPQCGHRFGMDCIYEWLTPTNFPNKNNCPICRAVFFEIDNMDDDENVAEIYEGDSEAETEIDDDDDDVDGPQQISVWDDFLYDSDDDGYQPRHHHREVLPELCVRLGQRTQATYTFVTQESYISALDLVEPMVRGEMEMPEGFCYSRQIRALLCDYPLAVFDQILAHGAESQIDIIAPRLAALMGNLTVRFGAQMENVGLRVPWGPEGPPLPFFYDFNMDIFRMLKDGVRTFRHFEVPRFGNSWFGGIDFGAAPRRNSH